MICRFLLIVCYGPFTAFTIHRSCWLLLRLQRVLRKTDDVKRELKWKSDAEAAAAAASSTVGSNDATQQHQQSVVRSCISRLRRGSDFKAKLTSRFPRVTTGGDALRAKPLSVEEEDEHIADQGGGDVSRDAVVASTASQVQGSQNDAGLMTTSKGLVASNVEHHETETDRRRQQVLAMLFVSLSVCLSHSWTVSKLIKKYQ